MSLGWEIYDKVWESNVWSKFGWLFLRNPNLATFEFWWIMSTPWGIMINPWSNDRYHFKMLMLTKNLEVWLYVGHSWLFNIQLTFDQLTANFICQSNAFEIFWTLWLGQDDAIEPLNPCLNPIFHWLGEKSEIALL